jgi:hypothetical protein
LDLAFQQEKEGVHVKRLGFLTGVKRAHNWCFCMTRPAETVVIAFQTSVGCGFFREVLPVAIAASAGVIMGAFPFLLLGKISGRENGSSAHGEKARE